jgi:uncharacterized repeat protein (TIGR01451 family)
MWGMNRQRGTHARSRFEFVGLVLALVLVIGQSVLALSASAADSGRSRSRGAGFVSDTSVTHHGAGETDVAPTALPHRTSGGVGATAVSTSSRSHPSVNGQHRCEGAARQRPATSSRCQPKLEIVKRAVNYQGQELTQVDPGDAFYYVINVHNAGGSTANGVMISDQLPDGIWVEQPQTIYYDIDPRPGSSLDGTCDVSGNLVTCPGAGQGPINLTADDHVPYGTDTVRVIFKVDAPEEGCGLFTNTASAWWDDQAPVTDDATVEVTGCAGSVVISKTADESTVNAGDPIGFTITVTNVGDGSADDVVVTDELPTAGSGLEWSIDPPNELCSIEGGTLTCDFGTLAPNGQQGDSASVHVVSSSTSDSDCGMVDNTAVVTSSDAGGGESEASVTVQCGSPGGPGIDITKTADQGAVSAGSSIGFTIEVSSTGDSTASDVRVSDTLPTDPGLDWTIDGGTGAEGCHISEGVLSCGFGDMEPGTAYTVHISSPTMAETCGTVSNMASVTSENAPGDEAGASVQVTCATNPPPPPPPPAPPIGIQIVKGGPALAHVGDTITYTFAVSLTTPEPLTSITVTDPICDSGPSLVSKDGGDQDAWLEPSETWNYSCAHLVTDTDPDPLMNVAMTTGTDSTGRTANDTDSHVVDIIHPAIEIVKTADPTEGSPGDTITYTFDVTNTGDVTLSDVSVDDDVLGHVGDVAQLDPGETVELQVEYVIPDATGPIVNVATVSGTDPLGEQVDARDDASVDVVLATTVTPPPTTTKTPPGGTAFTGASGVIPLAGIALAFLFVGSGLLWLGRRREGEAES